MCLRILIINLNILDVNWVMREICNDVMGGSYLNSDWNQGNILNLEEELTREGHTEC